VHYELQYADVEDQDRWKMFLVGANLTPIELAYNTNVKSFPAYAWRVVKVTNEVLYSSADKE